MADDQKPDNLNKVQSLSGGKAEYKPEDPNRKTSTQGSDEETSESSASSGLPQEGARSGRTMSYFDQSASVDDKTSYFYTQIRALTEELNQVREVTSAVSNDFESLQRQLKRKTKQLNLIALNKRSKNLRTRVNNLLERVNQVGQALARLNGEISAEARSSVADDTNYYAALGQLQSQVRRQYDISSALSVRLTGLLSEVNQLASPRGAATSAASNLVKKNVRRAVFAAVKSALLPALPFVLVGCIFVMLGLLLYNSLRNPNWDSVELAWACFREGLSVNEECNNELNAQFKEKVMVGDPSDPDESGGYINPNQEVL